MAVTKLLSGFSGSASIMGKQVLATSGTVTLENNQSFVTLMDIVPDLDQRTKVLYAPGTYITNGSLAWDVHANTMDLLKPIYLLRRGFSFTVSVWGGNSGSGNDFAGKQIEKCYVTSISMQGSQGGLLSVSLSFISSGFWTDWGGGGTSYISTLSDLPTKNTPYGYWYSGNPNIPVKDWSLSINQEVTPVFLNQYSSDNTYPKYMKCGLWTADLTVTTFTQLPDMTTYPIDDNDLDSDLNNIVIATRAFNLVGLTKTSNYNFTGSTDTSTYSYTFGSASLNLLPNVNIITSS